MATAKTWKDNAKSWLLTGLLVLAVYFAYVELQTYLGTKALAQTGLPSVELEEALLQAKRENKYVLVEVSAIWCPTCRRLDKQVLAKADVHQAIDAGYVFSRLEYESDQAEQFMDRYNVYGFPTLVILDGDGKLRKKLSLTFDPQSFIAQL